MRILVVCLGNICRSPTAEAALHKAFADAGLADRVSVESAGLGDWHVGQPPDRRMTAAAADVGLRLTGAARQVTAEDLRRFDLILAMDTSNHRRLLAMAPDDDTRQRIHRFREFEPDASDDDVPDPYYGEPDGFARVVDIVRAGADGVVAHVRDLLHAQR